MRTPEEQAWKDRTELVEEGLHQVLQSVPDIGPLWCPKHTQPAGNCGEDDNDCSLPDWQLQEGSVLTEYVLIVAYMLPNGEQARATWTSPRMPYPHIIGMLSVAIDDV